ncbi:MULTISPECIES: cation:proton antiporter [unclassified Rhizobium]|uniref:cation:proton antiporter domain-containing protein n=1 Tax=unclassified Rhizobium TaxID=2613769 RepID=UPI00216A0CDD|nr:MULTISPECIES: cation:proton antiporter [unclassified Rhizobium]MCS3743343.1 CPA2 family monovalent cation:H+ antiporter-2 [Rhizobium sp. BK661]MCS4096494.1 CPA2 family monovalent cation:H+ antiporter-2 [Rhizobium sp. BK176]
MHDLLARTLILLAASGLAVGFFSAFRMPAATGYLLVGVALGPHGFNLIGSAQDTQFLAELGLIFLMFMVGLEFSIPTVLGARWDVLGAGSLQVGMTMALVAMGLFLIGVAVQPAIIMGGAIAMSSTAIALKQLAEQGEITSRHGRLALGILLFQDLATLPLLILADAWSKDGTLAPMAILKQMAVATAALLAAAIIARPLIRLGFSWVLKSRSADLFLLWVLMTALGTAYVVHLAGLAPPIGAFVAGMVIGESEFRHRVEEDIRPFRDVLVGLFFITVGMGIDLSAITSFPGSIILWVLVFVPAKALLAFATGLIAGVHREASARAAVILAHGGEFGLLLMALALQSGIVSPELGQPMLIALALTMGLAPLVIQRNHWAEWPFGRRDRRFAATEASIRAQSGDFHDHVILCGCGRVGRLVATVLESADIPYIAIETDLSRYRAARRQSHEVVFGDARHYRILEAVGLERALLVVITFDHRNTVERVLHRIKALETAPASLVSTADDLDMAHLARLDATAVFPENLAAGLELADRALLLCGKTQDDAARIVNTVRAGLVQG